MNKIVIRITTIALVISLFGCGDEQDYFTKIKPAANGAHVKFVHAASDTIGVAFYINDAKISSGAAVNSTINYAGAFPGTDYSLLTGETQALEVIVPVNQKVMTSANLAVTEGNYYTVAFAGVTSAYEAVVINDAVGTIPFDGQAYIRFVNLIHNSTNNVTVIATPLTGDLTPITIAENVAYKATVNFTAQLPRAYTIKLVDAITPATVLATASAANGTLVGSKVYTLYARGQIGQGGAKAPTLDRMVNR